MCEISIIIPCFNQGAFLAECLNSVLSQSVQNWECIIYDDGSTVLSARLNEDEDIPDTVCIDLYSSAGEADELAPLEHTERLIATLKGPKRLVVYQDCRHSVGNVPSTNLGPTPSVLVADWMAARLSGKPFASERWFVRSSGEVIMTPL